MPPITYNFGRNLKTHTLCCVSFTRNVLERMAVRIHNLTFKSPEITYKNMFDKF